TMALLLVMAQATALPASALRFCAMSDATAQEAKRAETESARLVRMTGTRAPRTIPAESALARGQTLRKHVTCFEVWHQNDVRPTGHRRRQVLDRRGFQADGVVERQRPIKD